MTRSMPVTRRVFVASASADDGAGVAIVAAAAKQVLDFGKPDNALWRAIYFAHLEVCVPWLGRIFCGSAGAYGYILESLKHYPAQRGVAEAMQRLDCRDVRIVNLLGGAMSINFGEKPGR